MGTSGGAAYTVGGCEQDCTRPATTTGYTFPDSGLTETLAYAGSTFSVDGVTCASGYTGTVTATKCTSAGTAYSLSGCTQGAASPTPAPATPAPASNNTNSTPTPAPAASVDEAMQSSMISMSAVLVATCAFAGIW